MTISQFLSRHDGAVGKQLIVLNTVWEECEGPRVVGGDDLRHLPGDISEDHYSLSQCDKT